MTINEIQDEIIDEFSDLTDELERYAYIMDMGNTLEPFPVKDKIPANKIEGCQSNVWITARRDDDGNVIFAADSDALITKGLIALLLRVLSGHKPQEILNADLYFIDKLGLHTHLSSNRSNGLLAMLKQMRLYAQAYALMDKEKAQENS